MKEQNLQLVYDYNNIEQRELLYNRLTKETKKKFHITSSSNQPTITSPNNLDMKEDGFCAAGFLDQKICTYLRNKYYPAIRHADTKIMTKTTIPMEKLSSDPVVLQIFTKRKIVRTIENYLGIMPTIQSITSWRNIGQDELKRENEMYWHMDHHGHKFVKVFYYLTDVDYGYGHHQYITKTHIQRIFDDELKQRIELTNLKNEIMKKRNQRGGYKVEDDAVWPIADRIKNVTGRAGSGFMEDTRGLHRGTIVPTGKERIIIQALMLPFDSGKDKNIPKKMKKKLYKLIKTDNKYSDEEMMKLLHNLEIIESD